MSREKQRILIFFLIIFSIYYALTIGVAWDEEYHIIQGKITFFIIMTNRVVLDHNQVNELPKLINCFDKFKGSDIAKVERNGLLLSVIRKPIN